MNLRINKILRYWKTKLTKQIDCVLS